MRDMAIASFASSSTAAIASLSLGFVPDVVIFVEAHGGTNPNVRIWTNNATVPAWAAALSLLITGSSGIITRDTSSIVAFAGGNVVTADDVTARSYFKADGTVHAAGDTTGKGITIPAGDQTNSGANLVLAFRADR